MYTLIHYYTRFNKLLKKPGYSYKIRFVLVKLLILSQLFFSMYFY